MRTWVEVTLSNPRDKTDTMNYRIEPLDVPVAGKWIGALRGLLEADYHLEKNFCFLGWPTSSRDVPFLCSELRRHVEVINNFSDAGGFNRASNSIYRIDEVFMPETVINLTGGLNHDIMNRLHHHFEVLQGQAWNISPYFYAGDANVRYAIRQLNNLCHELESLVNAQRSATKFPEYVSCAQITTFLHAPRTDLIAEDYNSFTLDRDFGNVFMHYCQVGKTHYEVFCDQDEHVGDGGISGLKYLSGEFDIDFGPTTRLLPWNIKIDKRAQFREWLTANHFDPDDPTQGYGFCHMAQIDRRAHFGSMSLSDIQATMGNYLNISGIAVYQNGVKTEKRFEYSWADSDHEQQQLLSLKDAYEGADRMFAAEKEFDEIY